MRAVALSSGYLSAAGGVLPARRDSASLLLRSRTFLYPMKRLLLLLPLLAPGLLAQAGLTKDIEYAKAGEVSLRLDAFVPDGPGPFPAVIMVQAADGTAATSRAAAAGG